MNISIKGSGVYHVQDEGALLRLFVSLNAVRDFAAA